MIFWLMVIMIVVGVGIAFGAYYVSDHTSYDMREKHPFLRWIYYSEDGLKISGVVITVAFSLIVFIMSLCLLGTHIESDSTAAKMEQTYESLVYKINAESSKDDFGIRNKDLIDEVQKWNEDLAFHKTVQRNFWTGIFYADIYDDFEYIELKVE